MVFVQRGWKMKNKKLIAVGVSAFFCSFPAVSALIIPESVTLKSFADGSVDGVSSAIRVLDRAYVSWSSAGVLPPSTYGWQADGFVFADGSDIGARAVGGGILPGATYTYSASASYSAVFKNDSADKIALNGQFLIGAGMLYAGLLSSVTPSDETQYAYASYDASILKDGRTIWSSNLGLGVQVCAAGEFCSAYTMRGGSSPLGDVRPGGFSYIPDAVFSSQDLGLMFLEEPSFQLFFGYRWGDQLLERALGTLDPGGRMTLEYRMDVSIEAATDYAGQSFTYSDISDPFRLDGSDFLSLTSTRIAAVPEPSGLTLLGGGLLALFLRRRKNIQ